MTVISNGKYDYDTVLDLTMDKLILLYNKIIEMNISKMLGGFPMGAGASKQSEKPKHWEESIGNNMRREHHTFSIEDIFDNPDVVKM